MKGECMNILVTGGAGYIGSHTVLELLQLGHQLTVVDNLSNSSVESIHRIEKITNKNVDFYKIDLRNRTKLNTLFTANSFDAVIHFAGLKAVGESVSQALLYYHNNLVSTLTLLDIMESNNVKSLVFSSSATVYGDPATVPIKESAPKRATNPYGQTKLMIEQILEDISLTNTGWNITSLRYFNPIGAHESGRIGEDPNGIPNNLLPYISQVAAGTLQELQVFGADYPTIDGTGVRDYIHVVDLAKAHIAALEHPGKINEYRYFNVGTGAGTSVLEMIAAFEKASGKKIPYSIAKRRPGDIASCYADVHKINKEIGWKAQKTIHDACKDTWNWQSNNPNGYDVISEA